jgi:N,N'-diacetyllegionaminate synthase
VLLIAEIGQAHDGSLEFAHSYIDALANTGIDAIKWQTHIAEAESSLEEPFRVKFSYEDIARFDYWKCMEFTKEKWAGLKKNCERVGLEFISSLFSNAAVDLLEDFGVKRYKVGSGEISNLPLFERIAQTGKPIILSSGMSSFDELAEAFNFLSSRVEISIMQCFTAYPTKPSRWRLDLISQMKQRYQTKIGFSDHSGEIRACIAATALGDDFFEFHVVVDKQIFGPDAIASLTVNEVKQLANSVKDISAALLLPTTKIAPDNLIEVKKMFGKSLAVSKALTKGHKLNFLVLEAKKPSEQGISANDFEFVIGKILKRDMSAWSFLNEADIDE